ncbi:MAG: SUMF1/EgtB/PvdO family nonheme iron enzyme [Bacteroidetes bacterium]|jgi:formylglycine-generating enzyme required for sulfatase activity|nr:SUMF1/EgtB/PvdO family nonheme iron enzyme [Bacteroidota bacterium]MBT6687032.1 SUMF1/EgtB/PvdO family nonheme iron enzyme [Bacteroidota bacterium]MBT7145122.1 SUMF1/EgtB/PvdO family nonheme iron enzyme [Bacteroidota bacterium]MBT7492551.1 SUMF1/EgtB/PvdO family nonheme iron enzyme [Bacteroidota bacterium]
MKKLIYLSLFLAILSSCGNYGNGELTGVLGRQKWWTSEPYGMVFIEQGTYNMGPSDQDVPWAMTAQSKTVSISPFWMDETEITNNEYRHFVHWVRDSIARLKLGDEFEQFLVTEDRYGEEIDPPTLNWDERILWKDQEFKEVLEDMYYSENERFYRRKQFDTRKYMFVYSWIDLRQAAVKFRHDDNKVRHHYNFETQRYAGEVMNERGEKEDVKDRSAFIKNEVINIYPDTLCWIQDFTYSYNEPMTNMYFWHPAYDHYPVVGVSWKQAFAFTRWRTELQNSFLAKNGGTFLQDYRLPLESEWEYASRGGQDLSMYPWGGYYTRNNTGCFIANFKPMRGNYTDDGGIHTVTVGSFEPNEFLLYDMAGNVAEWTSNAFDESAYSFTHDLNSDYQYNALPDDPDVLKRKVIRGGSWKDIGYFLQTGTRTYEYQDTAKSYIGFRCVRSYLGRDRNDVGGSQFY